MEHANKLMLVDPAAYNASQRQQKNVNSDLYVEIKRVLDSDFPDDVKAGLYDQAIRKYRYISDGSTQRTAHSLLVDRVAALKDDVINSLPPSDQYKARRIWHHLDRDSDQEWSDNGQLIYRKSLIPNSHASELFQHIFKKTKRRALTTPDGSTEFVQSLLRSGAPLDILPNPKHFEPPPTRGRQRARRSIEKERTPSLSVNRRRSASRKTTGRGRKVDRAQSWESL